MPFTRLETNERVTAVQYRKSLHERPQGDPRSDPSFFRLLPFDFFFPPSPFVVFRLVKRWEWGVLRAPCTCQI